MAMSDIARHGLHHVTAIALSPQQKRGRFSDGANIASALLLRRPDALATAVLLAATVPFRERPPADLTANRPLWPTAAASRWPSPSTETLNSKLRDSGADVRSSPRRRTHIRARELPLLGRFVQEESIRRETCDGG
jgi:phospholipase/carboxylesterase